VEIDLSTKSSDEQVCVLEPVDGEGLANKSGTFLSAHLCEHAQRLLARRPGF